MWAEQAFLGINKKDNFVSKGISMKSKRVLSLSVVIFFSLVFCNVSQTWAKEEASQQNAKSIWEDDSAANPYFRPSNKKIRTAAQLKAEKQPKEPKRSKFKRRVYTGPSKSEIKSAASKKAVENFKAYFTGAEYEIKYDNITYNIPGDVLSVVNFRMVPKKGSADEKVIPEYLVAEELSLRNFNIGEKNGTPLSKDGELKARKVEIPVWNENAVKKGKIEISQLKMTGDVLSYLKAQGDGKLKTVEVKNLHSETIINETILSNIVRSKIFSASSAAFVGVELQKNIIDSLKHQKLDGLKFEVARINNRNILTPQGVAAVMTSYSARILNTDLVLGARLEAQKDKPVANIEQLKKNAEENKAAIAAIDAEMKSK